MKRDVMRGILGHPLRRAVVAAGDALHAPISLSRTADAVVDALAARTDPTAVAVDATTLELQLHHTHLPKLDAAGVLAYDAAERTVVDVDGAAVTRLSRISETLAAECAEALATE